MGFKDNDDFARFLTMGAYAAAGVTQDLESRGHHIIELERYAKANKIWNTKVKRLRLPDLICTQCGRRFESKGKTKLELKLSHSTSAGREWWAGGMRPNDVFAFVRVALTPDGASLGRIIYTTLQSMHDAKEALIAGERKARSAGSETDVSWPSWAPSYGGELLEINEDQCISVINSSGKIRNYGNSTNWPVCYLHVLPGEKFGPGDVVASCIEPAEVACPGSEWDWKSELLDANTDDRFAAIKTAKWRDIKNVYGILLQIANDAAEDWRIRLEAAASLSAIDSNAIDLIFSHIDGENARPDQQMEATFVLAELPLKEATEALLAVAQNCKRQPEGTLFPMEGDPQRYPSEVRAAAVWGLGLGASAAPEKLEPFLYDSDEVVALHAAASLPTDLPPSLHSSLVEWIKKDDTRQAAVAAHLLARHGHLSDLISAASSTSALSRALALRALGDLPRGEVESKVSTLDSEAMTALTTIWVRDQDWLRSPTTEGGLSVLDQQKVRL